MGEGPEYVPLVRRSHQLWRELEAQTGARLLTQCGGLIFGRTANQFLEQTRASAREYGIVHENMSSAEIGRRFPMFAVDPDTEGYFEPEAGYVRPEAGVSAQLALAREHGAELRLGTRVQRWAASATGVTVVTDAGKLEAERLVLCAGPWIGDLFPQGRDVFAVYQQFLYWFEISEHYERWREMPTYVWDFGGDPGDFVHFLGVYGFPAVDGPAGGVKLATETYERTTVPDGCQHPPTTLETAEMFERLIAPRIRWLGPRAVRSVSCLYTSTRSSRFVIDRHPDHESVLIVSPCSGHGFKHSPAVGEVVAQWLTAGSSEIDLRSFTLARVRE
jgi:sarcosine oxidase